MQDPNTEDPKYDDTAARRLLEDALRSSMPATDEQKRGAEELFASLVRLLGDVGLNPEAKKATDALDRVDETCTIPKPSISIRRMGARISIINSATSPGEYEVPLVWSTSHKRWEGLEDDRTVTPVPGKLPPRRPALVVLAEEILSRLGISKPSARVS